MTGRFPYEPKPRFLTKIATGDTDGVNWDIYCAGFGDSGWRAKQLASHLWSWLPAIVLHPTAEPPEFGEWEVKLAQAARHVFKTDNVDTRGELGEILLHIICRQHYGTYPTLFKLFYKTSENDVIKGFDMMHTVHDQSDDSLQIWFGEAKFYTCLNDAVRAAISSLEEHLTEEFLDSEKAIVGPKIHSNVPGYEKIMYLLEDISVNAKTLRAHLVVPIFLTFDFANMSNHKESSESYIGEVLEFAAPKLAVIKNSSWFESVKVKVFTLPLGYKKDLVREFSKKLKGMR
jgi:hypothetical protein